MTTAATFIAAVRGIPTHYVVKALNRMTPGTIWTGCSKALMAEDYERSQKPEAHAYPRMRGLDLERLARLARAAQEGKPYWWKEIDITATKGEQA